VFLVKAYAMLEAEFTFCLYALIDNKHMGSQMQKHLHRFLAVLPLCCILPMPVTNQLQLEERNNL
jgi:hypothetical protein